MSFSINSDLSENVAYNRPLFPAYVKKGTLSTYPNYSAVSHWHDDLEMNILINGSMDFNVNGEVVRIKDGILVDGRQLHFGFSKSRQECEFLCVLLHPDLLCANDWFRSQYVLPFLARHMPPYLLLSDEIPWHAEILRLAREFFADRTKELSPFLVQSSFFKIFELLYQNLSGETAPANSEQMKCMKKMIGFIQKNYYEPISLEQIAQVGECCKSKCSGLFKSYLSQSPIQYLIAYRLNKSIGLLQGTDQTITEIAYNTGFHGSSYYCEAFRKHFGLSPKEYRTKMASRTEENLSAALH
ncbi:MAG: AraC family transcriptional regulator [Clostridium sp.]|nr:AraC family transcriptional regulator [Clostridium sp.]